MNLTMKRNFIVASWLFAIALFSSCGHMERDRKYFMYYKISATNDSLELMTKEWHQLLDKAVLDNSYTTLAPYRLKMGKFLSKNRNQIGDLNITSSNEPLVDSELAFLSARATIVTDVYPKFEPFNEMTPPDLLKKQLKTVANDMENEIAANNGIKRSLYSFVVKNKLKFKK